MQSYRGRLNEEAINLPKLTVHRRSISTSRGYISRLHPKISYDICELRVYSWNNILPCGYAYDKRERYTYNCNTRIGANRQPVADSPSLALDELGNRVLYMLSRKHGQVEYAYTHVDNATS